MIINFETYDKLPEGNLTASQIITQSEWEIEDTNLTEEAIVSIIQSFNQYSKGHHSVHGMLSYACFLSKDSRYIIHFSQWKDKQSIYYFDENDPKKRIPEMLSDLSVKRLGKDYYILNKFFEGKMQKEKANLIVFEKKYFDSPKESNLYAELILRALESENLVDGLVESAYYVREDGKGLLNYAIWESEEKFDAFLQHTNAQDDSLWLEVQAYNKSNLREGSIIRCNKFVRLS